VATYTSRTGLRIPENSDPAALADITRNWNRLDGTSGLILVTESTKPVADNYPGKFIKCTDSGKHYYLDSTGTWSNGIYTGGVWVEDYYSNVFTGVGSTNIVTKTGATYNNNTSNFVAEPELTFSAIVPGLWNIKFLPVMTSSSSNVPNVAIQTSVSYTFNTTKWCRIDSTTAYSAFKYMLSLATAIPLCGVNLTGISDSYQPEVEWMAQFTGTGSIGLSFMYTPNIVAGSTMIITRLS
jgi:hypothetical protein